MRIHDDGDFTPFTALDLPFYVYFNKKRTDADYEKMLREIVNIHSITLFQLAGYLSNRLREEDDETGQIVEFISLVSKLGEGFQHSVDYIDRYFNDRKKAEKEQSTLKPQQTAPSVLDLSSQVTKEDEYTTLANHLSAILRNEKTTFYATAIIQEIEKHHPDIKHFTVKNLSKMLRVENTEEDEISQEKAQVLDLSSQKTKEDDCIDLARNLSNILNDPKIPKEIYQAIHESLCEISTPEKFINSPEYLEKLLCNQEVKEND